MSSFGGRDSNISVVPSKGIGSPCGACKFLRRKCAADCIFAPYFSSDQGPARFAAVHKVFGASNVSKMLMHLPVGDRCEAVVTIVYEAQARIRDPVYGCVAHVFALQQQVAFLQAQLMHARAQLLARNVMENSCYSLDDFASPKRSLDSIECRSFGDVITRDVQVHVPTSIWGGEEDECSLKFEKNYKNDPNNSELGELHSLAFRMMRNY